LARIWHGFFKRGGGEIMKVLTLVVVSVVPTFALAQGASRKEIYELQERCGRRAEQLFEKDFPKGDRKGLEAFENHYNVRLNRCFMLEENTSFTKDASGKTYKSKFITLVDVNDNKVYGSFSPINCDVQNVTCKSEQEFRAIIKPVMDE
jgi:hypothetical protein